MSTSEVLIIGAGPFGVSISAHLHGLGVNHQIVGRPMDTWRARVPIGMLLKSEPYASEIASPTGGYDLAAYYKLRGLDYIDRSVTALARSVPRLRRLVHRAAGTQCP